MFREVLILCATSVFSVSLWLILLGLANHRDTEDTEVAQSQFTSTCSTVRAEKNQRPDR